MSVTLPQLDNALLRMGSDVTFHREIGGNPCPCLTYEGFRDPAWHRAHPFDPVCNEQGLLVVAVEFVVKAAVQSIMTRRGMKAAQWVDTLLGEAQQSDRLGIFPCVWNANVLDFNNWSSAGNDYILYGGERYTVVAAQKIADIDGDPSHHWEVGLRLIKLERLPTDLAMYPDSALYPDSNLFPV